ncbi:hypothetical protein [Streptomyces alkaliphilus]|uniref:hypothetical protein n=1 Tax=Streptomyces alkaliphilus TaxID=1472722 RepID=UPI002B1FF0D8|nr:hypothetical protein [Streptomyces alkaliphilus]
MRVDLLLEVADIDRLTRTALARINADELLPDEERGPAGEAVSRDPAEAIAYLVDPIELVEGLPGVELARASWSSETVDADDEGPWLDDEYDDGEDGEDGNDGVAVDGYAPGHFDTGLRSPHEEEGVEEYDTPGPDRPAGPEGDGETTGGAPDPGGYGRLNGSA